MLESRKRGISFFYTGVLLVLLPLWFLFLSFYGSPLLGTELAYTAINFPLYLLCIDFAVMLAQTFTKKNLPQGTHYQRWLTAVENTNKDLLLQSLLLFAVIFAAKDKAISRQLVILYLTSSWFILLMLNRYLFHWLEITFFHGEHKMRTLLVGGYRSVSPLQSWIQEQSPLGIEVVGLVVPEDGIIIPTFVTPLGKLNQLSEIIRQHNIQQLILLETRNSKEWVNTVSSIANSEGCRLLIFNHWEDYFRQPMKAINEGSLTFFVLDQEPLQNPWNRFIKRVLDILISLPVVIFVLPVLSIIVKTMQCRQSEGPLFFVQKRGGFARNAFPICKYRTLKLNTSIDASTQVTDADERIYPFGHFLRKTSLDEFPQFWNVLIGQMSIVGPRPHMIEHDEQFSQYVELYRKRHFVKPGITGLAQERGFRGEIKNTTELQKRVELDLEYIRKWSIWLDIGIILRTFLQVIFPPKSAK
jgi:putative colanic acid biosynthesis UDP-glucose lipid carrier transferase